MPKHYQRNTWKATWNLEKPHSHWSVLPQKTQQLKLLNSTINLNLVLKNINKNEDLPDTFADFLENKVKNVVSNATIDYKEESWLGKYQLHERRKCYLSDALP